MALRPILILPDPRLRKVASPVAEITPQIETLAQDMLETMYDAPGIGLAATQIGVMKRVFVMDCSDPENDPAPMVVINPEILSMSDELETSEEGCLSIPEIYGDVTRPERLRMRWMGLDGQIREEDLVDRWAVCAQHEIDHLDGKLFIDYLGPVKRRMIMSKMKKLQKDRLRSSEA